jgi:hypothetical protein
MKLINNIKQHLKNSVNHYMIMRLKFRSDAFAGKAAPTKPTLVQQSQTVIVRH